MRPLEVEALQYDGKNIDEVKKFAVRAIEIIGRKVVLFTFYTDPYATTPAEVEPGDWIVKGVKGEFFRWKPEAFALMYDPIPAAVAIGKNAGS